MPVAAELESGIGRFCAHFCLRGTLALVQIPVVETRLACTVLLRVFVDEVPPPGQRDKAQNGPLERVEPTEKMPPEGSGRLPPGRCAAPGDENGELSMKGGCPPREPTLMHSESLRARANSGWRKHECAEVPRCFGYDQPGQLVSTSWGQGKKGYRWLAQRPGAAQVHPTDPSN